MSEETNSPKTSRPPRIDSNSMGHPVFGDVLAENFPPHRLPTFLQVLNRVRYFKSQLNSGHSLRSNYNLVASELSPIWKEAFVVPIPNDFALTTKLQTEIEKKIKFIQNNLSWFGNNPEKLEAQLLEMKKVYSITKCKCFLKKTHRQDVISSNCHCDNPILNLECYGDQLFGFNQIILFEEEKAAFTRKLAELEAKSLPTPPSSTEKVEDIYRRKVLSPKRARPISYGNPSDPEDVEMEVPDQKGADWRPNWDPVLETMLAKGLKPFAIMQIISKYFLYHFLCCWLFTFVVRFCSLCAHKTPN